MLDFLTVLLYIMCYAIATGVGLYFGYRPPIQLLSSLKKKIIKEKH